MGTRFGLDMPDLEILLHQVFSATDHFHLLPGPCHCIPYLPFYRTNLTESCSITKGLVIRARQSQGHDLNLLSFRGHFRPMS